MGFEIDLLKNYPRAKRNLEERSKKNLKKIERSQENLARIFLMERENTVMEVLIIMKSFGKM